MGNRKPRNEVIRQPQEQIHRFNNTIMGKFEKQRNDGGVKARVETEASQELELDIGDSYTKSLDAT